MMSHAARFYAFTGGPGAGKTSLLTALTKKGFATCPEAGRHIIQQQSAIDGDALPWADRLKYAELQLSWDMRNWHQAQELDGPVFFDRGVVDCTAYLTLCGLEVPAPFKKATALYRYNPTVFIAPPWRNIYENDEERKQDFAEAVRTFDMVSAVYEACGYTLVELPQTSVAERVAFVLKKVTG